MFSGGEPVFQGSKQDYRGNNLGRNGNNNCPGFFFLALPAIGNLAHPGVAYEVFNQQENGNNRQGDDVGIIAVWLKFIIQPGVQMDVGHWLEPEPNRR